MSKLALTVAAVPLFLISSVSVVDAQQGKVPAQMAETRATKSKGAAAVPASDPATLNAANDREAGFANPTSKRGTRPRGQAYGYVFHDDNRTDYYLNCYFNGCFVGTMGPRGALRIYVSPGTVSVLCLEPGTGTT